MVLDFFVALNLAGILVKYSVLLFIGLFLFRILIDLLNTIIDDEIISQIISLVLSIGTILVLRELFFWILLVILVVLWIVNKVKILLFLTGLRSKKK